MPNKAVLLLVLVAVTSGLSALEVQRGKVKLSVNEKTGRYVVWGSEDAAKPVWTALFVGTDPTTSKWKVGYGDKTYVLGDDPNFTTTVEATATGAKVTWTAKFLSATLNLDFLISARSAAADGVRLTMVLTNLAETTAKVGLRWVIDTNLGEKKDHFRLPSGEVFSVETKWEGTFPDFWVSRGSSDDAPGLLVMAGKGATVPARVVFANWKRIDDAAWDVPFRANRDFNLLPYSFNDSAVAQYYDAVDLGPNSSRTVVGVLGLTSAQTFADARLASTNPLDDLLKQNSSPGLSALDQDLASLDTLVAQIDAKLADPAHLGAEELNQLQAALDQIDARRKALEVPKP